ncbi:MAG: hypothetical protein JXO72_04315 [Vicinamibacteria bacterium]|nr:hypothetical protein [Vicinamibacteria bacterium]
MDFPAFFRVASDWLANLALRWKVLLSLILVISLMEFVVQRIPALSRLYRGWNGAIRALGEFWTAVILSIVYALAVGPTNLAFRARRCDLLDRGLDGRSSVWRPHVPNPLGPEKAARHQF